MTVVFVILSPITKPPTHPDIKYSQYIIIYHNREYLILRRVGGLNIRGSGLGPCRASMLVCRNVGSRYQGFRLTSSEASNASLTNKRYSRDPKRGGTNRESEREREREKRNPNRVQGLLGFGGF